MRSIYQVPFTALGMGAAFTGLWGVADPVAAHAEVRMYTGVGKCAMGDLVSPAQAKNYAREMARHLNVPARPVNLNQTTPSDGCSSVWSIIVWNSMQRDWRWPTKPWNSTQRMRNVRK